jgi:opacity protein-like surface antigen
MMKKIVIIILFFSLSGSVFSQINEAGIFLGGSNYIGDIGRTNFIYPNSFAIGGIYKWNMHPHYTIRATYVYSKISGKDSQSNNSFRNYRDLSFSNDLHELALGIEYHFFKYSLGKVGYTHTPYLFVQGGAVNYGTLDDNRSFNFTMPFGAGFKTILAPNVGIAIETGFRYTFKDDLDGYPYDADDANIQINPNNNDWYVFTGITIVFAFGREGCYTGSF